MKDRRIWHMHADADVDIIQLNESIMIPPDDVFDLFLSREDISSVHLREIHERGQRVRLSRYGGIALCDFGFGSFAHLRNDKLSVFARQPFCVCCKAPIAYFSKFFNGQFYLLDAFSKEGVVFNRDHVVPKSRGGRNALENYVSCCWECNEMKGNSPLSWPEIISIMLLSANALDAAKSIRDSGANMPDAEIVRRSMIRVRRSVGEVDPQVELR